MADPSKSGAALLLVESESHSEEDIELFQMQVLRVLNCYSTWVSAFDHHEITELHQTPLAKCLDLIDANKSDQRAVQHYKAKALFLLRMEHPYDWNGKNLKNDLNTSGLLSFIVHHQTFYDALIAEGALSEY